MGTPARAQAPLQSLCLQRTFCWGPRRRGRAGCHSWAPCPCRAEAMWPGVLKCADLWLFGQGQAVNTLELVQTWGSHLPAGALGTFLLGLGRTGLLLQSPWPASGTELSPESVSQVESPEGLELGPPGGGGIGPPHGTRVLTPGGQPWPSELSSGRAAAWPGAGVQAGGRAGVSGLCGPVFLFIGYSVKLLSCIL